MHYPLVSIIGRPNVGKSSLVNRISGKFRVIVDDQPGITRDRLYVEAEWLGHYFTLIDTGGIFFDPKFSKSDNIFQKEIEMQVQIALQQSDLVLFIVNVEEGITPFDLYIAKKIQAQNKPAILVINKVDNQKREIEATEFYELGFDVIETISALHGRGVGNLLDKVIEMIPNVSETKKDENLISITIAGKPNVGKSSLLNVIAGEERAIVSEVSGTTRDNIDVKLTKNGIEFLFVDTAGIRKKSKITDNIENYSVHRSMNAISRSDIVLFMIDATQPIAEQDKKIAGMIEEEGKGCILIVNKWDLVDKELYNVAQYEAVLRKEFFFLFNAPILFVSAKTGQRVHKIFDTVISIYQEYTKRIPTAQLNAFVEKAVASKAPPSYKGHRLKIYYATQANNAPPLFLFFVNNPDLIHFSYRRYLENQLREAFGFNGVPIRLSFRQH